MGSIQRRKTKEGTFYFTAKIRRRGHPHLFATFARKTDAKAWVDQEETKIRQGIHLDYNESKRHTLCEAIDRFLSECDYPPSRATHLTRWKESLGYLLLSAVNKSRINETTSSWKERYGIGPATINRHLDSLSILFKSAGNWEWTQSNPVREATRHREPPGRVRYLSDEERERLLSACQNSIYPHLHLIVVLALSTGMRREELLGLRWSQINLSESYLILTKTKNKKPHRVAILGLALELLKSHAKLRQIDTDLLFPGERPSSTVSRSPSPRHQRHFDIRKSWERALRDANITDFRFHDLRHSCASYLAMNKATLLEIADVLGHSSIDVTTRYAHLAETHVDAVVGDMNKKIFG